MKIDKTLLKVQRVEIIERVYNKRNQVVREQIEYYYPDEVESIICGFKPKKSKKK